MKSSVVTKNTPSIAATGSFARARRRVIRTMRRMPLSPVRCSVKTLLPIQIGFPQLRADLLEDPVNLLFLHHLRLFRRARLFRFQLIGDQFGFDRRGFMTADPDQEQADSAPHPSHHKPPPPLPLT